MKISSRYSALTSFFFFHSSFYRIGTSVYESFPHNIFLVFILSFVFISALLGECFSPSTSKLQSFYSFCIITLFRVISSVEFRRFPPVRFEVESHCKWNTESLVMFPRYVSFRCWAFIRSHKNWFHSIGNFGQWLNNCLHEYCFWLLHSVFSLLFFLLLLSMYWMSAPSATAILTSFSLPRDAKSRGNELFRWTPYIFGFSNWTDDKMKILKLQNYVNDYYVSAEFCK